MHIRRLVEQDREQYLALVQAFYTSPAVLHDVPKQYFIDTFEEILRSDMYVDGFFMEMENGEIAGYAVASKMFSQECGGLSVWLEELSVLPQYQNQGIGKAFFDFVVSYYPTCKRFRLEVERDNHLAIALYERLGYSEMPYYQMVRDMH